MRRLFIFFFFFFNDTATTEIYTLSLHDALPISRPATWRARQLGGKGRPGLQGRSEEHTSELQSQSNLVCRLLLEKKKKKNARSHVLRVLLLDEIVYLMTLERDLSVLHHCFESQI